MKYLKAYPDRHGKWRIYFRRPGYKERKLPVPPGYQGPKKPLPGDCLAFLTAYQECLSEPLAAVQPGEQRAAYGSVAWLVTEYLGSLDFLGRPESMRRWHRRYVDDFRVRRGERLVAGLETHHFESRLATMIATPAAANEWLTAMRDLMAYAVKRKLIPANPVAGIKKRPSGNPNGHHCWTPEQVEQFRATHPIGTRPRLAMELIVRLALRRSDVIRLGPPDLRDGKLIYTQHKNREHKPSQVDVPLPAELKAIIAATPGTGIKTWLVDGLGKPFTEDAFAHWFADASDAAGLPKRLRPDGTWVRLCTAHGLRKRCLTDLADRGATTKQIQGVSGHRTLEEIEKYTLMADRARNAAEAMRKQNRKATGRAAKGRGSV
ncbi:Site-specific recombinase XerD [Rhizobiales bacterium GAS191]|nr:Site-specific recombinase XerD [Rhizobiales bacterium GAS191]